MSLFMPYREFVSAQRMLLERSEPPEKGFNPSFETKSTNAFMSACVIVADLPVNSDCSVRLTRSFSCAVQSGQITSSSLRISVGTHAERDSKRGDARGESQGGAARDASNITI
jgi:hypothetical protein